MVRISPDKENPPCIWYSRDDYVTAYENRDVLRAMSWDEVSRYRLESFIAQGAEVLKDKENEKKYGHYFKPLFAALASLSASWLTFRFMFTDKHCEVDGLLSGISTISGTLHDALFESALLAIARLAIDGKITCNGKNLTLEQLIDQTVTGPKQVVMLSKLGAIKSMPVIGAIRLWRHKKLSHLDFDYALGKLILPPLLYADVDALIAELHSLFDEIGKAAINNSYHSLRADDIRHSIEHINNTMTNGARMSFLSHISSIVTGKWDRQGTSVGAMLLHPKIVEMCSNNEFSDSIKTMATSHFVDLSKVSAQCSEIKNHVSPF